MIQDKSIDLMQSQNNKKTRCFSAPSYLLGVNQNYEPDEAMLHDPLYYLYYYSLKQ